jgi:hypothetical protein
MDLAKPEKNDAARTPTGLRLTPPRMTTAQWQQRSHTSVTLTRSDLEPLAQLMSIGRAVLRDRRPMAPHRKAVLSRLGVATSG